MLVGVVSVASVVMAQSTGNRTITVAADGVTTNEQDRAFERLYGSAGISSAEALIVQVNIAEGDAEATGTTLAIVGLNNVADTTPNAISGYQLSSSMFEVAADGMVSVKNIMMPDPDNAGALIPNPVATEALLTRINDPDGANTFTFNVLIFVDTDTGTDSNPATPPANVLNYVDPEVSARNARNGFVAPTGLADANDDLDEVNTLSVTVRILKAKALTEFAAIPGSASANDLLYGPEGESRGIAVTGIRSGLNIVPVIQDAAATVNPDNALDGSDAFYGAADAQNVVWLRYFEQYAAVVANSGNLLEAGTGADADPVVANENARLTLTVSVDTNPTDADGTGNGKALDGITDATNSPDDDETVVFTANVRLYNVLKFAEASAVATGAADKPYSFSIRSNASDGTQAGVIQLDGAADAEDVDVIVRGSTPFKAEPRKVGDAYTQVVVMAARQLTTADEGMHDIVITINGRALPTRTAQAYARVQVTASNPAPTSGYDADNPLIIEINETDKDVGKLIDDDDDLKTDLADYVSDDSDASSLRYTVSGTNVFTTDGSKLVVTGDVSDSEKKSGTGEDEDDDRTANIDERIAVYERSPDDGGKYGADGTLAETADEFADITYKFNVEVKDAANTLTIPVVVKLNVNEPVMPVTEGLPAGVTYDAEHKVLVDDDDDDATDRVEVTMPTYFVAASYSDRDVPVTLFNFGQLASDSDSGDDLDAEVAGNPPHIVHDGSTNNVILTYMPPNAETGIVSVVTVGVSDGFNPPEADEDDNVADDVNLRIEITVMELPPEPVRSEFTSIVVEEGSVVCVIQGGTDCSLAGVIAGGVAYKTESGVDVGPNNTVVDYSVSDVGVVSVVNSPDYEAEGSPAFLVNVFDDLGDLAGIISVRVVVTNINEIPVFAADSVSEATVSEDAQNDDPVATFTATDQDAGDTIAYSIKEEKQPFSINSGGELKVKGDDAFDINLKASYELTIVAGDGELSAEHPVTVTIDNANDAPSFDAPVLEITIPENTAVGTEIADYDASDPDGDALTFTIKTQTDTGHFTLGEIDGKLSIATGLDYETQQVYLVEINVSDPFEAGAEIQVLVTVTNVNDESPVFDAAPATSLSVPENTARGFVLANYSATDADGDTVKYTLSGDDAKSFMISDTGDLMTLESLDADRQVPCGAGGCAVTVTASDMPGAESGERVAGNPGYVDADVRVSVTAIEDSVSTLDVTKANPVPGTESGHPMSALAGVKTGGDEYLWNLLDCPGMLELVGSTDEATYCKMWDGLGSKAKIKVSDKLVSVAPPESPYHLPASYGSAPVNFVETEWANWGTILRIEVIAESPSATCDNGNQCVVVKIESESADTDIWLKAYRSGSQENKFVAALMLVERSEGETASASATEAVYAHSDGNVARLKVDEEDEIEIEFGNLRGSIEIENEDPEISNFAPEHEAAFDDPDVDYTFRVMDDNSGLPEAEDLPDVDGDDAYTPVVALISKEQCETVENVTSTGKARIVELEKNNYEVVEDTEGMLDGKSLYCRGDEQDGEFDAKGTGYGFAPIRDDRDFDKVDDGYDVKTTIVLDENKTYYVTFIACDNAGNCTFYDPDGNDDAVELAEITVDIDEPDFVEARTGLTWDSTDNEYDDNKSFIQVIFNDLTNLNVATVEIDDFVVEGHTVKDVHIFENPDDDDVDWGGGPNERYASPGNENLRDIHRYRDLENAVFVELEDELLADETPDVAIVPNGVEDKAGNEQDDGDNEADDWISPTFTIVSMVSTLETSQSEVLAGDDDEVTVVVTSDERLDATRPTVTVTYVNAPAGSVITKGTETCDDGTTDGGTRDRGEIVLNENDPCGGSRAAGGTLNNSVEKVSNTEWIVTITEPKDTGYYNFRISGKDRSPQNNPGSEGVSPGAIVSDFFDADGDVNVDDAIFFEGDINLPKPEVRVSGVGVQDNEADVEFRSPLFVELDFAAKHSTTCSSNADTDERMANCMNENSEYAEDNFDDVVVTSFVLDGVDITDSVKTTDNQSFLVSLESISIGDHTAEVQAVDQAGNVFEDTLEIDFEVNDRDPFEKRLSPGWNLVSLPGEPADSSIAAVFGPGVEVRTVYSYDPVIPGGWQVAVRETLDSDWQGDLTEINGQHGYWVLSDAIQDWEVSIPRLAGGAAGTGTPIQPPVIPLYAGWNLIPVTDISGNGEGGQTINADVYLQSLDDGVDLARVLGFDTISNQWETVLDPDMQMNNTLTIGSGYWIFVREAASLVPSGYVGDGVGD